MRVHLPTVETQDASERSKSLWEPLRASLDVDVLSALNMGLGPGGAYCSWIDSEGTESICHVHRSVRGESLWPAHWRPDLPTRSEVNRFHAPFTSLRQNAESSEAATFRRFYGRFEGRFGPMDKLRVLFFSQGRFQGYVGLLRHGRTFSRRTRQRLAREALPLLRDALDVRNCLEAEFTGEAASVVLRANGSIEFANDTAARWLTGERSHDLGRIVRHADAGLPPLQGVGNTKVRLTRLMGIGGARYLAILKAASPVPLHPFHVLSPRQRSVADQAAQGATVGEIAASLGITPDTTRQHLKGIYEALGIGCRVELFNLQASHRSAL